MACVSVRILDRLPGKFKSKISPGKLIKKQSKLFTLLYLELFLSLPILLLSPNVFYVKIYDRFFFSGGSVCLSAFSDFFFI